jgi:hypothetical protein
MFGATNAGHTLEVRDARTKARRRSEGSGEVREVTVPDTLAFTKDSRKVRLFSFVK